MSEALDDAKDLLGPLPGDLEEPLALRLDVGLSEDINLLGQHDLDNYLFPLAFHLTKGGGMALVSAWATKAAGDTSAIRYEVAQAMEPPGNAADYRVTVRTTASTQTQAYKRQISEQLTGAELLAPGPVSLELAFVVGPGRNWLNLWKPTIDSLDKLLGRTRPTREWHPQDGRITELGLHRTVDPGMRNDVVVTVTARPILTR